ncbi:hypothetical protein JNUCC64_14360 [Streptomyces sp. JNUCC 64]
MTEDQAPTDSPARLDELRSALDVLEKWPGAAHWPDVQTLAGRAAPLVWEELKTRWLWDQLPSAERAAVYWALATGHAVRTGWAPEVTDWRPVVAGLVRECAFFAFCCEPRNAARWPEAEGRLKEGEQAAQGLAWYLSLRPAWRAEVFRLLETGHRADPAPAPDAVPPSLWGTPGLVQQRSGTGDGPRSVPVRERAESTDTTVRFAALPEGWQVETMRRIALGHTPHQAVTNAAQAIAALPHFGIALHPTPPP